MLDFRKVFESDLWSKFSVLSVSTKIVAIEVCITAKLSAQNIDRKLCAVLVQQLMLDYSR